VPQSQPALSGGRSLGRRLTDSILAAAQLVWLTTRHLWAKIFSQGEVRDFDSKPHAPEEKRLKSASMAGHREDFILMIVGGITLDPSTKMPIVVLKDPDNKLNLHIWIGPLEATAMATELEGIKTQRPMTHDLLRNLLVEFGATVELAEITELRENTYYARIQVKTRDGKAIEIDSRPSDAIALALRTKSPIYVAKQVLEASSELHESQGEQQTSDQNLAGVSRDKWSEILERMSPEDFKYKM
jgi:bifunctional DNase/RNase